VWGPSGIAIFWILLAVSSHGCPLLAEGHIFDFSGHRYFFLFFPASLRFLRHSPSLLRLRSRPGGTCGTVIFFTSLNYCEHVLHDPCVRHCVDQDASYD
jgi:hypothetical protein